MISRILSFTVFRVSFFQSVCHCRQISSYFPMSCKDVGGRYQKWSDGEKIELDL